MLKRLGLAAALLVAVSHAYAQPPAVQTDVRALGNGQWQADYLWDEPVEALRFLLPGEGVRQRWTIATPGLRLEPMGRTARLVREDGESFAGASIQFATDTTPLNNAYEFFAKHSDGGLMLYTGYLVARPMREADKRKSGLPGRLLFKLHARDGEQVVAGGAVSKTAVEYAHSRGGTYAYFGKAAPIDDAAALGIIDPGAPDWVRETVAQVLPATMAWFTEQLGVAPAQRPALLLNVDPDGERAVGGGVLNALVHIALLGDWTERSDELHARLVRLVAHESAHIWNSRIVRNRDGRTHRWLHEGSADALADAAIADLGFLPAARVRQFRDDALNDCVLELGSDSLAALSQRRRYGAHYDCGSSFERIIAKRAGPVALWRQLIARASAGNGRYTVDDYLAAVSLVTESPDLAAFGQQLATQGFAQPEQAFAAQLTAAGYNFAFQGGPPRPEQQERLVQIALVHLVQGDCGKQLPLRNYKSVYVVRGVEGCLALRPGETYRIERVNDHAVGTAGAAAYDAIVVACSGGDPALLGDGTEQWPVPCNQALPPRPRRIVLLEGALSE